MKLIKKCFILLVFVLLAGCAVKVTFKQDCDEVLASQENKKIYSKEEIQKRTKEILDNTSDPIEESEIIYNYADPLNPFNIEEEHSRTYEAFGQKFINSPMVSIKSARESISRLSKIDKENLIFLGYVIDSRTNEKIAAFYNNSFDSEIDETIYGFLVDTNGGTLNESSDKFNQYYLIGSDGIMNIKNRDILVKYHTPLTEDTYEMLKDNVNRYIKDN